MVASAPDIIITVDEEGLIQFANPAAHARFVRPDSNLVGTNAAHLFETRRRMGRLVAERHRRHGRRSVQRSWLPANTGGELRYFEASASRWRSGARPLRHRDPARCNRAPRHGAALRHSESEARNAAAALTELNRTLEERVQSRTAQLIKAEAACVTARRWRRSAISRAASHTISTTCCTSSAATCTCSSTM